jgi:RND family efflux transporter MFP subunit
MKNISSVISKKLVLRTLVVAVGSAVLLAGCGSDKSDASAKGGPGRAGVAASAITTMKKDWAHEIALDAEVVSLASPNISAEVSGKVTSVSVMPGESVKKGQVMVIIDQADLALSASESEAQAAQIAAQLADKERNLARNEELAAKEYIGRATLEASQTEVAALTQQLKAAKVRSALSRANLAKTHVAAPYDAVVAERNVAPGTYVRAGDVLVSLWSPAASSLRVRVPQEYAGQVAVGQTLNVSWGGKVLSTKIARVRSDIDPESRSFEAQATVPAELQAVTGASLSATLEISKEPVLAVPAQAVQMAGANSFVFVVGEGQKALKKTVVTGRQKSGQVEIKEGIAEGDKVLVEGAAFAQDGKPVSLKEAPKPAEAAKAESKGAAE